MNIHAGRQEVTEFHNQNLTEQCKEDSTRSTINTKVSVALQKGLKPPIFCEEMSYTVSVKDPLALLQVEGHTSHTNINTEQGDIKARFNHLQQHPLVSKHDNKNNQEL